MSQPGVYPTNVFDEEWAFVAPYLCLMKEDAPQRTHPLRAVFDALRYMGSVRVVLGGSCPMIYRLGRSSTSRPNAGWRRASSRRWLTI